MQLWQPRYPLNCPNKRTSFPPGGWQASPPLRRVLARPSPLRPCSQALFSPHLTLSLVTFPESSVFVPGWGPTEEQTSLGALKGGKGETPPCHLVCRKLSMRPGRQSWAGPRQCPGPQALADGSYQLTQHSSRLPALCFSRVPSWVPTLGLYPRTSHRSLRSTHIHT